MKPQAHRRDGHRPVAGSGGLWHEKCRDCGAVRGFVGGKPRPWRKGGLAVPVCPVAREAKMKESA